MSDMIRRAPKFGRKR